MFNKIAAWFISEASSVETSIEGILSQWFKAVKQLEQHAAQKITEAAKHEADAAEARALAAGKELAAQAAKDVAVKANSIAAQLSAVVTSHANATPAA